MIALLAYRFLRSPGTSRAFKRLEVLEHSLRALVKDAETSSKSLVTDLRGYQGDLRKLLLDIETAETRLNRALSNAEEMAERIVQPSKSTVEHTKYQVPSDPYQHQLTDQKTSEILNRLSGETLSRQPMQYSSEISSSYISDYTPVEFLLDPIEAPEPPRFEMAVKTRQSPNLRPASNNQNISKNPSNQSDKRESPVRSVGLASSVERINEPSSTVVQGRLSDVYSAAEEMLRAGNDLNIVASTTNLPIEQIKVLSRLVKETKPVASTTFDDDPRLGALNARRL